MYKRYYTNNFNKSDKLGFKTGGSTHAFLTFGTRFLLNPPLKCYILYMFVELISILNSTMIKFKFS